jgi:hypothetical protein
MGRDTAIGGSAQRGDHWLPSGDDYLRHQVECQGERVAVRATCLLVPVIQDQGAGGHPDKDAGRYRAVGEAYGPSSSENKAGSLSPEHFVWAHGLDAMCDASVGNLYLLDRVGGDLMGHDIEAVSMGVSNQVIVSNLEELVHCSRLVVAAAGPSADRSEARNHVVVGRKKKLGASGLGPFGELVVSADQLITNLLDAEDQPRLVVHIQPIPKSWTKVEAIVQVLRLDEDVGIEQVWHRIRALRAGLLAH